MLPNNYRRLHLVPFIHQQNSNMTFQHGNVPPHIAIVTQNFFAQNNIKTLGWAGVGGGALLQSPKFFSPKKKRLGSA